MNEWNHGKTIILTENDHLLKKRVLPGSVPHILFVLSMDVHFLRADTMAAVCNV